MLQADDDRASLGGADGVEAVDLARRFKEITGQSLEDSVPFVIKVAVAETHGDVLGAQDLAQQVWAKIFKKLRDDALQPVASTNAWLTSLVRRTAIDEYRRTEASKRQPGERLSSIEALQDRDEPATPTDGPERCAVRADLSRRVRRAVAQLPDQLRAVLECVLEGHTHTEIAEILGIPVGTVKTRITSAKDLLKGSFDPDAERED